MAEREHVFESIDSADFGIDPEILDQLLTLAVELAREGREGRKVGTIFMIGDADAVLARSRPLILDPLQGHPPEAKRLGDPGVRETLKELAQLDGAFVLSKDGIALSAARYLDADSVGLDLPLGLGARHVAAASASKHTQALAVVVSESSVIRLFHRGELISEIIPELWMLRGRHEVRVREPHERREGEDVAVARSSLAEDLPQEAGSER